MEVKMKYAAEACGATSVRTNNFFLRKNVFGWSETFKAKIIEIAT